MRTSRKSPSADAKDLWFGLWNKSEGVALVSNSGRVFISSPLARRDLFVQPWAR